MSKLWIEKRISLLISFILIFSSLPMTLVSAASGISITYEYNNDNRGTAGGTLSFTPDFSGTVDLFWGADNDKLVGYTELGLVSVTSGTVAKFGIQEFTVIPDGASQILGFNGNNLVFEYKIPVEKQFDFGDAIFTFGTLSDAHFGTRYGSRDIPKNAFSKAVNFFGNSDVDLIAISGDITNDGSRADLLDYQTEVNKFASNFTEIPIYTVTGNHDASGLSLWNTYTADSASYAGDYVRNYAPNNLDFTVDIGDDDIFIFLNQQWWSSSKILENSQLDWLSDKLADNYDKRVYLYSHQYLDNTSGDVSNGFYSYNGPVPRGSNEERRLFQLLETYKNTIMFSGHSHWMYYLQSLYNHTTQAYDNTSANIYNGNGKYGTMVHVGSVTEPRDLVGTNANRTDKPGVESEGYLIDVYEDCVVLKGYDFQRDRYLAYANYIIETADVEQDGVVENVLVDTNATALFQGDTLQLNATIVGNVPPQMRNVIWESDGGANVTVSKSGLVNVAEDAVSGKYTITARSESTPTKYAETVITVVAFTEIPGTGTLDNPYIIADESHFLQFTNNMMSSPEFYTEKYIIQAEDIDMQYVSGYNGIGSSYYFKGNYDGGGHTINVKISSSDNCIFPRIGGDGANAVIINLGTTGSITGTSYAAGIARSQGGSNTQSYIINCWSTAKVSANNASGIVSTIRGGVINSVFAGELNGNSKGAITGSSGTTSNTKDCYFYNSNGATLNYSAGTTMIDSTNLTTTSAATLNSGLDNAANYLGASGYTRADLLEWTQSGDDSYPVHAGDTIVKVTIDPPSVNLSPGKSLQLKAIVIGNVPVQSKTVVWESDSEEYVKVSQTGLMTVTANAPAGTYTITATSTLDTDKFAQSIITVSRSAPINGTGIKEDPYIISNEENFMEFTNIIANDTSGNFYKGKYIKQTADIDMSTIADYKGVASNKYFKGYYDGSGHVINVNITGTTDNCIFPRIGETGVETIIMNLGTTGKITGSTSSGYAGGIVRSQQDGAKIINCWSTIDLTANRPAGITPTVRGAVVNCIFAGSLTGNINGAITHDSGTIDNTINCYFWNSNDASINYSKGVNMVSWEELTWDVAKKLNDGIDDAADHLGDSGFTSSDLTTWDNSFFPMFAEDDGDDYTQFVDPFVGTSVDYGQLFPGAVVPYGLVKLSPDTYPHSTNDHAGYDYNKTTIQGFSHTRVEGVGGQGAGGDVLVTPSYVDFSGRPAAADRAMAYSHDNEEASPGYYSVDLRAKTASGGDDGSLGYIKAEMSTDTRTGYHRYTFPSEGKASIGVDLNYTYHGTDVRNSTLSVKTEANTTSVSGRFSGKNVSGHGLYTLYFYMETSKPASSIKSWNGNNLSSELTQAGNDLGALLFFDVSEGDVIEAKVSISPISAEQAKRDMYAEIPWDSETFESTRENAKDKWNEVLGRINVKSSTKSDPTGELKRLLYTNLYHMFMTPVNATSTDNTFRATDTNIYKAEDYTHYDSWTLWDDFRKYPMIGLVYPEAYKDIIRSLANTMEYGIGTWGISTQTVPTVRTEHAVALLADGIAKGFTDIENLVPAYEKAKKIADAVITPSVEDIGYISGRLDRTVEFSYDDWAISLLADHLNLEEEKDSYLARSFSYKNLYKPNAVTVNSGQSNEYSMGLLWPRNANGTWLDVNPETYGAANLYQGTVWQYTWWDSNDVKGLMDLMGGQEDTLQALSYLYGEQAPDDGKRMLHSNTNEIDLHTPYLFNFAGKPSRTQYWVRQIHSKETWNRYSGTGEYNPPRYEKVFQFSPRGYMETMDDDAGTMSAMYVAAAMGLFPMTPGDTTFQIGSPFFEEISLDVGGDRKFIIKANGVSPDNFYIQSATLNGHSHDRTWVDYSEILRGGTLEFQMGSDASTWAEDGVLATSSSETANTLLFDKTDAISYSMSIFEESALNDGSIGNSIVVTAQDGVVFNASIDEDLIENGKMTIENVPQGLTAKAVALSTTEIEISFIGKASLHQLRESIGDLSITIEEALLPISVSSKYRIREDIKVMFDDYRVDFDKLRVHESADDNGTIDETVDITLTGGIIWNAVSGEELCDAGKAEVYGLPQGLGISVIVTGDTTAILSFSGAAIDHHLDIDDLIVSFSDQAFIGATTAEITNSSFGGMESLILDFTVSLSDVLEAVIIQAESVNPSKYVKYTYNLLLAAITDAKTVLSNLDSTQKEYQDAYDKVYNLLMSLVRCDDGFERLEGEASDRWSEGSLKNETSNLGGITDGAWVAYLDRNFGNEGVKSVTVRYDNNGNRCAADASLEIRLGGVNGTLLNTVELPQTNANGWGTYNTVVVELDDYNALSGVQDIYIVFKGTTGGTAPTGGNREFICNLDYIEFESVGSYGRYEGESNDIWSGGTLKTETSTGTNAGTLVNIGATYDGAWIGYYDLKFAGDGLKVINAHYSTSSSACPAVGTLEIRKDSPTGEIIGTLETPNTGSWATYNIVTIELITPLVGTYDIFMVMVGEDGKQYVCNFDYLELLTQLPAKSAYNLLEAEERDSWSGGALKTENGTDADGISLVNLGATYDGAWMRYNSLDFGLSGPSQFVVRYVNNSSRCASDATLELRIGDENGAVIKTMEIPATGNSWNAYELVSFDLSDVSHLFRDINDVTIVLKGTTTGANPFIANIDYFQLIESKSAYNRLEAEDRNSWSGGALKTETSTDSDGVSLISLGATYNGAWLHYDNLNFGVSRPSQFMVRYANNSSRCAADAALELRVGDENGILVKKMEIPSTGNSWNSYKTAYFDLADVSHMLTGAHDITIVLTGTTTGSNPFIANVDYFGFLPMPDADEYGQPIFTVNGDPISSILEAAGEELNATMSVKRIVSGDISFVVALYNSEGILINVSSSEKTIEAGSPETLNVGIDIPSSTDGITLKLFVWEADTYMPLVESYVFK